MARKRKKSNKYFPRTIEGEPWEIKLEEIDRTPYNYYTRIDNNY